MEENVNCTSANFGQNCQIKEKIIFGLIFLILCQYVYQHGSEILKKIERKNYADIIKALGDKTLKLLTLVISTHRKGERR